MKKNKKLLGITLIIVSLLLQVGYATANVSYGTVRTGAVDLEIRNISVNNDDPYIDVTAKVINETKLMITANKLYPGCKFEITTDLVNIGSHGAVIEEVIFHKQGSNELMKYLVSYDENGNAVSLDKGLYEGYKDKTIPTGNGVEPLVFKLGLSEEFSDVNSNSGSFNVEFRFKQAPTIKPEEPGGNEGGTGDPGTKPDKELPSEEITDEEIPLTNETEDSKEDGSLDKDTDIGDGEIPLTEKPIEGKTESNKQGQLPKTGTVPAVVIYGFGMLMLIGGVLLMRMEKK